MLPSVISSRPARQRSAVVLPQPEGPTSTRNSCSLISISRSFSTETSPKRFQTWSNLMLAIGVAPLHLVAIADCKLHITGIHPDCKLQIANCKFPKIPDSKLRILDLNLKFEIYNFGGPV